MRSIKGKLTEIQALTTEYELMCFTETHLDCTIPNALIFEPSDKAIYRKDRSIHGRGVMIAINSDITHNEIDLSCNEEVVGIVLPPNDHRKGVVILCVYNPPGLNLFFEEFHWLDEVSHRYPNFDLLLLGDFNMPDIDWENSMVKEHPRDKHINLRFLNVIAEFHLEQLVMKLTHVLGNTLDLVLSTNPSSVQDLLIHNPGFSDHFSLSFVFTGNSAAGFETPNIVKMYGRANTEAISSVLCETLKHVTALIEKKANINEVWDQFQNDLEFAIKHHIPTKTFPKQNIHEPFWFNKEARKLVNKQRKLYNKYKKTKCLSLFNEYKTVRRENKKTLYLIKRTTCVHFCLSRSQGATANLFIHILRELEGARVE